MAQRGGALRKRLGRYALELLPSVLIGLKVLLTGGAACGTEATDRRLSELNVLVCARVCESLQLLQQGSHGDVAYVSLCVEKIVPEIIAPAAAFEVLQKCDMAGTPVTKIFFKL